MSVLAVVCLVLAPSVAAAWESAAVSDPELLEMRGARRAASRLHTLQKDAAPRSFGLLVVPVEFADTRFPEGWEPHAELGPALDGTGEATMTNFFRVASDGRLEMHIVLAPTVRLPQDRAEYSYIGYTNAQRSRMMATETLEQLRDWGFEFRLLDRDGPDGLPASGDDDGEVDGVLLLHAGIGTENDLENGLIPAHQYFLTEPVVSGGVEASFYAVAAHASGLGIWAHETAHLLGMEDRYDPRLAPEGGSEVQSRGGLGRFNLMSSGAWGIGDGISPALPDAYSCLQMGWITTRDLDVTGDIDQMIEPGLVSGRVGRIWTNGAVGDEFYLVETRDPEATRPFDQAVPAGQLIIYHVDESQPEGYLIQDAPDAWHLRVRLVEADGDTSLELGDDDGGEDDVFPGNLGIEEFTPLTTPSSDGYHGSSFVQISGIESTPVGVAFRSRAIDSRSVDFDFAWSAAELEMTVRTLGGPWDGLRLYLDVAGATAWGEFGGGGTSAELELVEQSDGIWTPAETLTWIVDAEAPAGAATVFGIRFAADGWSTPGLERTWVWSEGESMLDFAGVWPGEWVADRPGFSPETAWFRWTGDLGLNGNGSPVLACVDEDFADGSDWPDVRYNNYAHATLTSGALPATLRGVRLVHAIEGEHLSAGTALDGGRLVWVGPDGDELAVQPLDGWQGVVENRAYSPLYGQGVLTGTTPFLRDGAPVWHTDVFPAPETGTGPWRLRLVFASDASAYRHGWFVASIEAIYGEIADSAFPVEWAGTGLIWSWPFAPDGAQSFLVETYDEAAQQWTPIAEREFVPDPLTGTLSLDRAELLAALDSTPNRAARVRIVGEADSGLLASRPVTIYPDGGPAAVGLLGTPWPNPSPDGSVRFLATVPNGPSCRLRAYDLRGRLVRSWSLPSGNHFLLWEGKDSDGRRLASGTYFLRLEGPGAVMTRKVVFLH